MAILIQSPKISIAQNFGLALEAMIERYRDHRMFRKTITELNALSDRELHDLGINRSGIKRLAIKAVYGE